MMFDEMGINKQCKYCGSKECDSLGCTFREMKELSKKKKKSNVESSLQMLTKSGIEARPLNIYLNHYRVMRFDFWPSTGVFYCAYTKEKGRGVRNLINVLKKAI